MLLERAARCEPVGFRLGIEARQLRLTLECSLQFCPGGRQVQFGRRQLLFEQPALARQLFELLFALLHRRTER